MNTVAKEQNFPSQDGLGVLSALQTPTYLFSGRMAMARSCKRLGAPEGWAACALSCILRAQDGQGHMRTQ